MEKKFKYSAFIRKNTPELRMRLERLGIKIIYLIIYHSTALKHIKMIHIIAYIMMNFILMITLLTAAKMKRHF